MKPNLITALYAATASIRQRAGCIAGRLRQEGRRASDSLRGSTNRAILRYRSLQPLSRGRLQGAVAVALASLILLIAFQGADPARREVQSPEKPGSSILVETVAEDTPPVSEAVAQSAPPETSSAPAETAEILARMMRQREELAIRAEQARREQAVALEQARLHQLQQLHMQRQAEIRHQEAVRRAHEAAQHQIRRYEQDVGGTMGSILGY